VEAITVSINICLQCNDGRAFVDPIFVWQIQDDACIHRNKVLFVGLYIYCTFASAGYSSLLIVGKPSKLGQAATLRLVWGRYRAGITGAGYLDRYSESLRYGQFGGRIPVGARFSAPVQTGPGAYPASYTEGTGSFPGVKRPGPGVDHPPLSSAEVKERVEP